MTNPGFNGFSVSNSVPLVAEEMDRQTKYIRDALDTLERMLQPMKQSWGGRGADAYEHVQRQWDTASINMANRFGAATQAITQAYSQYQRTDLDIQNRFTLS